MKDAASPLPHMLPPAAAFGAACDALGIAATDSVVLYDGAGLFSAARGWWMLRAFGHAGDVAVLDGGLPAWRAAGHAVESGAPRVDISAGAAAAAAAQGDAAGSLPAPRYKAELVPALVLSLEAVLSEVVGARARALADARPAARFAGAAPEPRAGLRGGHIPGSVSVPFSAVLTKEGKLLPRDQLLRVFAAAGLGADCFAEGATRPLGASCGTGVTACVVALAAAAAGRPDCAVYDGSWTEWGGRDDTPVATGDAQ